MIPRRRTWPPWAGAVRLHLRIRAVGSLAGRPTWRSVLEPFPRENAGEKIIDRVASFLADWFRDGLVSRVSVVG